MHRLSLIISTLYHQYLPLAQAANITLNIDLPDPTKSTAHPERVKQQLELHLRSAIKRSAKGSITISIQRHQLSIHDTGSVLSKQACAILSGPYVSVKSRVGFGTLVTISY